MSLLATYVCRTPAMRTRLLVGPVLCLALTAACGDNGGDDSSSSASGGGGGLSGGTGGGALGAAPGSGGMPGGTGATASGGVAAGGSGGALGGASGSGGTTGGASGSGGAMGGTSGSGGATGGASGSGGATGGASGSGGATGGASGSGGATGGASGSGGATGGSSGATTGGTGGGVEPVACQGSLPSGDLSAAQYSVTVESDTSWGNLPHFWNTYGTGHLGLYQREDRGWGEILRAHTIDGVQNLGLTSVRQHGLFHDDIGIYSEQNGVPVYDFTRSDEIFDFFVGLGIAPVVELAPMPRDLASNPAATVFDWQMGISVPKDFGLWQDLVNAFVSHSVDRYGADVVSEWYFEVWNEPECCGGKFWTGTMDQYFELYDHAEAAVHAALPNARVGGPVTSQPFQLVETTRAGVLFLDHVTTDNYLNPGNAGILDFFSYHSWTFLEGSVNGYFVGIDLLDSYGLNNVGVALTEFGPTYEFNLLNEPQETRQGAAFVAQTYADIAQRCARDGRRFPITYSWWVLSDVFEEETYREDEPFIGCMGLTSREGIHKPAYNAYRFLAQMGNEQVSLNVTGPGGVGGMAARSSNGAIQVIVYNAQNPGEGPSTGTYYELTGTQEIGVTVTGLPPDLAFDVTAYRVDETRGNAYATWENLGRPSMSAMSDADWQALRDTMDAPAEPLGSALCGDSFTGAFDLPSPGVLFVTLTPAVQ